MVKAFWIVANSLNRIAAKLNLTYNEVNIIVYYFLVPLSWVIMGDVIIGTPIYTVLLLAVWSYILFKTGKNFRSWCDYAFQKSQDFLLWFKRIGWNYIVASVVICVIIPVFIYILLAYGIYLKYF